IPLGGLGVRDLARTSLALRTRWLWFSRTDTTKAWAGLDLQFDADERAFFFASTTMQLGSGTDALFWEDRWIGGRSVREIAPLLYACIPKRRRKLRTVVDGLADNRWARDIQGTVGIHEIGQYLQLWHRIAGTTLSAEPDRLIWRWSANGVYSAKSAYTATFAGSTTCAAWKLTWKHWAPPRVRFFHWLAHLDRCWTADRLARRGLQHPARCPLCDQA
uniref:Reverse transcriptase zinc-binding domain-containing protein n=1 Tax=Aegilops tauschii subsp. strangulata TaxID=200361 RepID=A0A452Y136_AEGTS